MPVDRNDRSSRHRPFRHKFDTDGIPVRLSPLDDNRRRPRLSANLGVDWRFVSTRVGDLRLSVDANYYAKQYFDAVNTERIAQGAYTVTNARLSLDSAEKRGFNAGLWIKNLSNTQYLAYGLAQRNLADGGLGLDYALVGEPRTYGVDIGYRF